MALLDSPSATSSTASRSRQVSRGPLLGPNELCAPASSRRQDGVEHRGSLRGGAHRSDELVARHRLQQVSRGSGLERSPYELVVVVRREDHDPNAGVGEGQVASDVDATAVRQSNVDEDDVGHEVVDHGQRGVAVVGLADDDDVLGCLEHLPGPRAQHLVIVDDQDPQNPVVPTSIRPHDAVTHLRNHSREVEESSDGKWWSGCEPGSPPLSRVEDNGAIVRLEPEISLRVAFHRVDPSAASTDRSSFWGETGLCKYSTTLDPRRSRSPTSTE